jgi:hypothetical protein
LLQLSSDDDDDIDEEDEDFFKMIYAGAMLGQTYVDIVGGNRARRWTPTQQPPDNPSPLRRKAAGGPPRKRAEKL